MASQINWGPLDILQLWALYLYAIKLKIIKQLKPISDSSNQITGSYQALKTALRVINRQSNNKITGTKKQTLFYKLHMQYYTVYCITEYTTALLTMSLKLPQNE